MTRTLKSGDLSLPRDGDTIRGHAVWLRGAGPFPGLVLIPDLRGLSLGCASNLWMTKGEPILFPPSTIHSVVVP